MTGEKFYKNHFALVIDLGCIEESNNRGNGKQIFNMQNGVLLDIKNKATSVNDNCNIFVHSDALVNFVNNDLQIMQYTIMEPFNMIIVGMTCGKTNYLLNMLEKDYNKHFHYIILIIPNI